MLYEKSELRSFVGYILSCGSYSAPDTSYVSDQREVEYPLSKSLQRRLADLIKIKF
ncbi:hypothetical protein MKW98_030365, partial [Papaver atlanticum]